MIVVEHDLAVLDYLSDYVCVLYGAPGAYGVVTTPFSVREGTCALFWLLSSFFQVVNIFVLAGCSSISTSTLLISLYLLFIGQESTYSLLVSCQRRICASENML